jgi:hypothetical protein
MRWLWLAIFVIGCGNNGTSSADAAMSGPDARPAADAPPPDAAATADASGLGRLCVTTADGGAGSCPSGIVCCSTGGTTICRLPADCPAGPGYKTCGHGGDCQGAICCLVGSMQFCTKPSVCTDYGGTQVP